MCQNWQKSKFHGRLLYNEGIELNSYLTHTKLRLALFN